MDNESEHIHGRKMPTPEEQKLIWAAETERKEQARRARVREENAKRDTKRRRRERSWPLEDFDSDGGGG